MSHRPTLGKPSDRAARASPRHQRDVAVAIIDTIQFWTAGATSALQQIRVTWRTNRPDQLARPVICGEPSRAPNGGSLRAAAQSAVTFSDGGGRLRAFRLGGQRARFDARRHRPRRDLGDGLSVTAELGSAGCIRRSGQLRTGRRGGSRLGAATPIQVPSDAVRSSSKRSSRCI